MHACVCLCVCMFFTLLTDRASTIPSYVRGCQTSTWSLGQEKIIWASTKLRQREHKIKKLRKNDKKEIRKKTKANTRKDRYYSVPAGIYRLWGVEARRETIK